MSDEGKILYDFVAKEGKLLGKKYHMSQCGIGGGVDDGISLMSLDFQRYGSLLTEMEARHLIVCCVNDYLKAVNRDDALRPFLKVYPFKPENIDLVIYSYHPIDRTEVLDPNIFIVSAHEGKVSYLTQDPENAFRFKSKKYESYDDALLILQKQNGSDQ